MHQGAALRGGHMMRGIVCALAGSVCWGFFRHVRPAAHGRLRRAGLLITCVRMLISAVFFLGVVFVKDWRLVGALFRDWRSMISIAAFSIFGIALCQVSYFSVIHHTSAGVGTTIEQLGLVLIMLWTCLRKRRLPQSSRGAWARVRHGGARPDRHARRSFPDCAVPAGMLLGHGVGCRVGLVYVDAG